MCEFILHAAHRTYAGIQIGEYECQREHFNHLAGWKPNLQTSTFRHTISLSLPALPPLYPLVSSSHLTPFVSQGPIKSPLPPSLVHLSLPPSLSPSQMSPSFFCSYSQTTAPCGWFNFCGPHHHLYCSLWSLAGDDEACICVCACQCA